MAARKWGGSSVESGILRKNDVKEKSEELLIFGYACKLFRDDEKALYVDQGKHLIPWMGDSSLKIDRYDVRGALSDLKPYEAGKEGYDATRWLGLSDNDRRLEMLCDEERYLSLRANEEEEELYKEEELKRLQNRLGEQSYGEVGYSYDSQETQGPSLPPEEDDELFTPPPELDIPINMTLPKTVKQNAKIEKTAAFISREGPQMEILIKAKQAGNQQFDFLSQESPLYRYYRHLLMAIKSGRYAVKSDPPKEPEPPKPPDEHYLHPSLSSVVNATELTQSPPPPPLPPVPYKPSADCAYSQLVNRIQGNQPAEIDAATAAAYQAYQQYNQYYYGYDQSQYYSQYPAYAQYAQPQQPYVPPKKDENNPYAQIVSNVKGKLLEQNISSPSAPVADTNTSEISKAPVLYRNEDAPPVPPPPPPVQQPPASVAADEPKKSLQILAQYNSDSDSDWEEAGKSDPVIPVPPTDVRVVIDKMATYVAKNGSDFEAIVRSKGDPRFLFLNDGHEHHGYYRFKLRQCLGIPEPKPETPPPVKEEIEERVTDKKAVAPVCFSIKKPKDSDAVSIEKSALPAEDSSEDEQSKEEDSSTPVDSEKKPVDSTPALDKDTNSSSRNVEADDTVMELIDLTNDLEEKRDAKRAEDKLRDKLAAAARERLASVARDRTLQMERKRRAAAFLSKLKPLESRDGVEVRNVYNAKSDDDDDGDAGAMKTLGIESRLIYRIQPTTTVPDVVEAQFTGDSEAGKRKHKSGHKRKSHKRSHSRSKSKKRRRSKEKHKSKHSHHHSKSNGSSSSSRKHKKHDASDAEKERRSSSASESDK